MLSTTLKILAEKLASRGGTAAGDENRTDKEDSNQGHGGQTAGLYNFGTGSFKGLFIGPGNMKTPGIHGISIYH